MKTRTNATPIRRCAAIMLVLLLCISSMVAYAEDQSSDTTEQIQIQIWLQLSDEDSTVVKMMKKAEEVYQRTNPNFSIEYVLIGDADVYMQKILLAADSGNLPDVFAATCANIEALFDSDVLLDITESVVTDDEWMARFTANTLENQYYYTTDIIYGIPFRSEGQGWFMNKALFDQIGMEIPVTWKEWVACIEAFKEVGITPIAGAAVDTWARWGYDLFFSRYGFQAYAESFKTGETKFVDAVAIPAFTKMQELYEMGAYNESAVTANFTEAMAQFINGDAAMMTTGTWSLGELDASEYADSMVFTWGPEFSDSEYDQKVGTKVTSWTYWVNKDVGEDEALKEAILGYLKTISDPEVVKYFVEETKEVTCYNYIVDEDNVNSLYISTLEKLADEYSAVTEISALIDPAFETAYWNACSAVMTGTATAEEAAKQLDDAMALILP